MVLPFNRPVYASSVDRAGVGYCRPQIRTSAADAIMAGLPPAPELPEADNRSCWERWQAGLTVTRTLRVELPRLRLLLIMDNLAGHKTALLWSGCSHVV